MLDYVKKEDCCGCQACVNICPLNCIAMRVDKEGFLYPETDKEICTNCGLCEKVCPFIESDEITEEHSSIDIYGAWCTDEEIRFRSSSGGLFTMFSEYVIEQGGIVFGVMADGTGNVMHAHTDEKEGIRPFRKSKYVQSDVGMAYQAVRNYLRQGRKVLFSGTPCQVMALHKFLRKPYDNLYTIDMICVGVSSPGVWKSYVRQLEKNEKSKVKEVIFRHKEIDGVVLKSGERNLTMKFIFENGKELYQYYTENKFFEGFLKKLFIRPSCAHCKAKNFRSGSDIQLGDFWELEKVYPEVLPLSNDGKRIPFGVSEVLIYTEKGKELFQQIENRVESFKADRYLVEAAQKDKNWYLMKGSSEQHWNRDRFFEEYCEDPQHVFEIIERSLHLRDVEHLAGKKIGMWGSFHLRDSISVLTNNTDCELKFQFRNSTITSIMSQPNPAVSYTKLSSNAFRNQMLQYDLEKEFRIHMKEYAEDADLFLMDFLEERYENLICGETIITKSEGYFESEGIQGFPLAVSFDMWKDAIKEFMKLVRKYFAYSQIIVVESFLCSKYGIPNGPKYNYKNQVYINRVNQMLEERYNYFKEQWPEITVVPRVPEHLRYTVANHRYGCIPEHMNSSACTYTAEQIGRAVRAKEQ